MSDLNFIDLEKLAEKHDLPLNGCTPKAPSAKLSSESRGDMPRLKTPTKLPAKLNGEYRDPTVIKQGELTSSPLPSTDRRTLIYLLLKKRNNGRI